MRKTILLNDFVCKICNLHLKTIRHFTNHIKYCHDLNPISYTEQILLQNNIPVCKCGCGYSVKIHRYHHYDFIKGHIGDIQREEMSNRRKELLKNNPEIADFIKQQIKKAMDIIKAEGSRKGENSHWFKKTDEEVQEIIDKRMKTIQSRTEEEQLNINKNISNGRKRYWSKLSDEELKMIGIKRSELLLNLPDERKKEISLKMSQRRKTEMELLGIEDKFKPSYNISTIPIIENILNLKYNTIFTHAESENGEFKIHDKELKKTYYADAYSEELNIWIEFDEPDKFKNGILKEEHLSREERIKKIRPDIEIIRIYFDKHNFNPNTLIANDSPLGGRLIVE